MSLYQNATAIVTGAGSGIGLALSESLIRRGAQVWLTDINVDAIDAAAERLGQSAHAVALNVCDAAAVRNLVESVSRNNNGLDLIFNNAGIGSGGETHLLTVDDFDRTIDVNIRGVVNGVVAAYPIMVERGKGCIVNTASASGLLPFPLGVPYCMTKHAVVGLSESLRLEAESLGVQVSALCPTAVETPILDSEDMNNPAAGAGIDIRRYLTRLGGEPYPVDKFAEYALNAVAAGKGIVVAPARARFSRWLSRMVPSLVDVTVRRALKEERAARDAGNAT